MKVVRIVVPPDKSISQRAIMLASISEGITRVKNLLLGNDCLRAIEAFRTMGVRIDVAAVSYLSRAQSKDAAGLAAQGAATTDIVVHGVGMHGLKKPRGHLYIGNSGTTMRILPGVLAGQDFEVVLKGDSSLSKRPMRRIVEPLAKMGVEIASAPAAPRNDNTKYVIASGAKRSHEIFPPLKIHGGRLKAIKYNSKIASAQVKSCILLAGLYADGKTSVTEPVKSRDHTERMLSMFGCRVKGEGRSISVEGPVKLKSPGVIEIPGDISSAAFFIVAGCILPGMKVIIKKVGLNPTRTGVIDILKKVNANISLEPTASSLEPYGDIIVKSSNLRGASITPQEVVRAIDEIPIIMVAACFAKGKTVIKGIKELRVKETDRVKSMVTNLRRMGADIRLKASLGLARDRQDSMFKGKKMRSTASNLQPEHEYIVIKGGKPLHGATVSSFGDHRTAMSMLITGLAVKGVRVTGLECIDKSFPDFLETLRKLN